MSGRINKGSASRGSTVLNIVFMALFSWHDSLHSFCTGKKKKKKNSAHNNYSNHIGMAFAGLIITPRHACAQRGQVIAVGLDIYI